MKKIIAVSALTYSQRIRLSLKRSRIRRDLLIRPLFWTNRAEYHRRSRAEHLLYTLETEVTPSSSLPFSDQFNSSIEQTIYNFIQAYERRNQSYRGLRPNQTGNMLYDDPQKTCWEEDFLVMNLRLLRYVKP